MWDDIVELLGGDDGVLIPYSSGMGVGQGLAGRSPRSPRLNTLFVRYGCGTFAIERVTADGSLNTLFVRYGCGTEALCLHLHHHGVLIPYSSGMGVGQVTARQERNKGCLNTLFVRYGCGTRDLGATAPGAGS